MSPKLLIAVTLTCLMAGCANTSNASHYDVPGFVTIEKDGRLWVFKPESPALADFQKTGEVAKQYTDIGGGPNGMTVKAADPQALQAYLAAVKNK